MVICSLRHCIIGETRRLSREAFLCRQQLSDGFVQFEVHHFIVPDPYAFEDRLIEFSAGLVRRLLVERVWVSKKVEPIADVLATYGEIVVDLIKLLLKPCPQPFYLAKLGANTLGRNLTVCSKVDEVVSLH
ncbi:hypothetical protein [Cryobacterium sp. GrIS_2_6]|uniref:hypothetical protein n=1 Tax=Cryobacterium sp. GrIS_2_6 TaxID=3162785 RepID=UPI002E1657B1